jgi:hypothetical protein
MIARRHVWGAVVAALLILAAAGLLTPDGGTRDPGGMDRPAERLDDTSGPASPAAEHTAMEGSSPGRCGPGRFGLSEIAALALLVPVLLHVLLIVRLPATASGRARFLARRGLSQAEIARKTGLAQDAVRSLLDDELSFPRRDHAGRGFRPERFSALVGWRRRAPDEGSSVMERG